MTGPDAGQTYHFEVKSATGTLSPDQKRILDILFIAGRGASGRSVENLCAALVAWGFPLRART